MEPYVPLPAVNCLSHSVGPRGYSLGFEGFHGPGHRHLAGYNLNQVVFQTDLVNDQEHILSRYRELETPAIAREKTGTCTALERVDLDQASRLRLHVNARAKLPVGTLA